MAIKPLSILMNRCPQCNEGSVFSGFFKMNVTCPSCEFKFEREPGYFLGAMLVGYFLGVFSVIPTLVICHFVFKLDDLPTTCIAVGQIVILQPLLFRYSRLVWLHVEQSMTKSLENRK
jgi:uncharacterized protein (DUF983 family)